MPTMIQSPNLSLVEDKLASLSIHEEGASCVDSTWHGEDEEATTAVTEFPSVIFPSDGQSKDFEQIAWSNLKQKLWTKPRGVEYKVEWDASFSMPLSKVAHTAAKHIRFWFDDKDEDFMHSHHYARVADLTRTLLSYVEFCELYFSKDNIRGYKLKLAAMHGSCATRCPAWHTDYVTVRCLKTFYGPGTLYLDPDLYDIYPRIQNVLKNDCPSDLTGMDDWKDVLLLDQLALTPDTAPTGSSIFLLGHQWLDRMAHKNLDGRAVLHRSPVDVPSNQGRVFLALDVVLHPQLDTSSDESNNTCTGECCAQA